MKKKLGKHEEVEKDSKSAERASVKMRGKSQTFFLWRTFHTWDSICSSLSCGFSKIYNFDRVVCLASLAADVLAPCDSERYLPFLLQKWGVYVLYCIDVPREVVPSGYCTVLTLAVNERPNELVLETSGMHPNVPERIQPKGSKENVRTSLFIKEIAPRETERGDRQQENEDPDPLHWVETGAVLHFVFQGIACV